MEGLHIQECKIVTHLKKNPNEVGTQDSFGGCSWIFFFLREKTRQASGLGGGWGVSLWGPCGLAAWIGVLRGRRGGDCGGCSLWAPHHPPVNRLVRGRQGLDPVMQDPRCRLALAGAWWRQPRHPGLQEVLLLSEVNDHCWLGVDSDIGLGNALYP